VAKVRGQNAITIKGTAEGDRWVGDSLLGGFLASGMGFDLDIDKAPTVDASGRTNYTEKNARYFSLITQRGWSAKECADRLAKKVNEGTAPFTATVKTSANGAATISFAARAAGPSK